MSFCECLSEQKGLHEIDMKLLCVYVVVCVCVVCLSAVLMIHGMTHGLVVQCIVNSAPRHWCDAESDAWQ